jgi:transposase-like protein
MLLNQFFTRFPDESSCLSYFKDIRQEEGITCPKCGGHEFLWLQNRQSFQCKSCGYRFSLTAGTVMEQSNLSLYEWFYTAHLMTSIKQVLSAKEVQHQLGSKQYPPVWLMMMKLRDIMGKRDAEYKFSGKEELDVSFFPTSILVEEGGEKMLKSKKTRVLVMAESEAVEGILQELLSGLANDESINKASNLLNHSSKYKTKKVVRYIKMFAMPNEQSETINPIVARYIDKDSQLFTDGGTSLKGLDELVNSHVANVETEDGKHEVVTKVLPWVHIVTSNCRRGIEAIHNEVDERFLQLYLNEYCWKFNRRFFRDSNNPKYDLFDHLIRIASKYTSNIKWRDYEEAFAAINNL